MMQRGRRSPPSQQPRMMNTTLQALLSSTRRVSQPNLHGYRSERAFLQLAAGSFNITIMICHDITTELGRPPGCCCPPSLSWSSSPRPDAPHPIRRQSVSRRYFSAIPVPGTAGDPQLTASSADAVPHFSRGKAVTIMVHPAYSLFFREERRSAYNEAKYDLLKFQLDNEARFIGEIAKSDTC